MVFLALAFSDAGSDIIAFVVVYWGSVIWALVWLLRVIFWALRVRRGAAATRSLWGALLYWGFEPAVLGLSALLLFTGAFMSLRFWLSAPAFERYVAEVLAGHISTGDRHTPRRIGLFTVRETELLPGGIVRTITAADFLNDAGFAYSPNAQPPRAGEDNYTHLSGAWWHWHRSW